MDRNELEKTVRQENVKGFTEVSDTAMALDESMFDLPEAESKPEAAKPELLLEIDVTCKKLISVKGQSRDIAMIPFTATAKGRYFIGKTIGESVDTQKITPDGHCILSARYMLEGKDAEGSPCRIFIENQGSDETGFRPMLVTDSAYLAHWETLPLSATIDVKDDKVIVRIYNRGDLK